MLGIFPADEYALYEQPVVLTATNQVGVATPLIGADPSRIVLLLGNGTSNGITFALGDGKGPIGIQLGLNIGGANGAGYVVFTANDHGPLCWASWLLQPDAVGGNTAYAVGYSLRKHPEMYGYNTVFEKATVPESARVRPQPLPTQLRRGSRPLPPGLLNRLRQQAPSIFGES